MLTRLMIISLLFATACTPNPVRNAAPLQENTLENVTQKPSETAQVTPIPSPAIPEESSEPTQATVVSSPVVQDGLQKKLTKLAMDDLATRLNTNVEDISIMSAEAILWPDAALGCPLSDKVYAQGRVPGFRIQLGAGGKVYIYHTDRAGKIVFCPEIKPDEPGLR